MNARILSTLILKDLKLYFRNRFFAFITVLALVFYTVFYILMPQTVDESLTLGVYAPTLPDVLLSFLSSNDITIESLESDEALQQAIIDNQYAAGMVLTGDVINSILRGQEATVTVYFASDAPQEIVDAFRTVLRLAFNELSYNLNGDPLRVEFTEQIVGPDMTGQQLAARNRLLPLLAVMVLVMEMMGLGSLISEEVEKGTLTALLITPVNIPGLFAAKAIMGVMLAFVQATIIMMFTGNLAWEPLLVLLTLLLGSLVVTGLGFLIASASRDMMGVMAWSVLVIILMLLPSYGVVFPGTINSWVKLIPSYYMVDTIHKVVNFHESWGAVGNNLLILFLMGVAFLAAGMAVMERKTR